jgi:hypothetical protein
MSDVVTVVETSMLPEQPNLDNINSPSCQISTSFLARKLLVINDELVYWSI